MGTKYKTKLMKVGVFATIISLALSLTALFYVTFSWFTHNRSATVNGPDVSLDQGLEYNLKYFAYNVDGGYSKAGYELSDVVSTSYATDFIDVAASFHDEEEFSLIEEPAYRVTFALEITSLPTGADHNITLFMTSYDSPSHEEFFRYDSSGPQEIHLSEAINIYSAAMVVGENDNDASKTAFANSFISNNTLPDRFDYSYNNLPEEDELIPLGISPEVAGSESNTTIIFFFTIEFSNTSETFYKFHSLLGTTHAYFEKDTIGNSNVFKGLSFVINEIMVRKEYVM